MFLLLGGSWQGNMGTFMDRELLKVKIQVVSCVLNPQDLLAEALCKFGSVNKWVNLGVNECSCEQVHDGGPVREEKEKRNMGDVEQNRNPRLGGVAPTFRKFPSLREATFRGQIQECSTKMELSLLTALILFKLLIHFKKQGHDLFLTSAVKMNSWPAYLEKSGYKGDMKSLVKGWNLSVHNPFFPP